MAALFDANVAAALANLKTNKTDMAVEQLTKLTVSTPPTRNLHYALALALAKAGNLTAAAEALGKELSLFPDNGDANCMLKDLQTAIRGTPCANQLSPFEQELLKEVRRPGMDLYDIAYEWGWKNPRLNQLIFLCYKTPHFTDNARRFFHSAEFQAAINKICTYGLKPSQETRVLDFACGNGIASYALAKAGYTVVGIDSSLGNLAGLGAAKQIQGLDGAQFELKHSTGECLDFPDNTFELVWIREALHHMKNLPAFLTEIKRVLKPGGVVTCFRDPVIWNESQRERFFQDHPLYHITLDEGCYYLKEYLDGFHQAGLLIREVLDPYSSVINTYPDLFIPGRVFDPQAASKKLSGEDRYSFIAQKS